MICELRYTPPSVSLSPLPPQVRFLTPCLKMVPLSPSPLPLDLLELYLPFLNLRAPQGPTDGGLLPPLFSLVMQGASKVPYFQKSIMGLPVFRLLSPSIFGCANPKTSLTKTGTPPSSPPDPQNVPVRLGQEDLRFGGVSATIVEKEICK